MRRGRGERHLAAAFCCPERRDRVADRLAHGDREHQRRLAHRLAAVHRPALRRLRQERHVELGRRVAEGRDLVGARRVRQEAPAIVPEQLLARQPAHALHERALDLPAIDARVQRVAHVVEDVHAEDALHPAEAVDLDLARHRSATPFAK